MPDVAATVTFEGKLGGSIMTDLTKVKEQLAELTNKEYVVKMSLGNGSTTGTKAGTSLVGGFDKQIAKEANKAVKAQERAAQKAIAVQEKAAQKASQIRAQEEKAQKAMQDRARRITERLKVSGAKNTTGLGLGFDVKRDAWRTARRELQNMGLSYEATNKMTAGLRNAVMQVNKVETGFVKAGNSAERMVRMTVQGVDQMGNMVKIARSFDHKTGTVTDSKKIIQDFAKAQKEAEKVQAKSAQATNTSSAKAVADMSKQLGTIRANFNALDHSLVGGKAASGIASEITRVQGMLNKLSGTKVFDEKSLSLLNQAREAFSGLSTAYKQYASSIKSAAKDQKVSETNMQRAAAQAETLRNKMMTFMSNNPRLAGTSYASQINSMLGAIDGGKVKSLDQIKEMKAQYAGVVQTAKEAGKLGPTLGQSIAGAFSKFGGWMLVTHSMMMTIRMFKDMISNVKELDTAMVGLKRVTNLTDQGYQDFFDNAITRSKQVGATLTDTMNATVDFARLGYDVDEASKLADVALVYKNVGVGVEDIDTASSDLISTMKAFGTETKDAQSIVDKFNETGKNCCPAA